MPSRGNCVIGSAVSNEEVNLSELSSPGSPLFVDRARPTALASTGSFFLSPGGRFFVMSANGGEVVRASVGFGLVNYCGAFANSGMIIRGVSRAANRAAGCAPANLGTPCNVCISGGSVVCVTSESGREIMGYNLSYRVVARCAEPRARLCGSMSFCYAGILISTTNGICMVYPTIGENTVVFSPSNTFVNCCNTGEIRIATRTVEGEL